MASRKLRAAICHLSPVFLSASQTTQKSITHIHRAAKNDANLIVFPETYIPAFPVWSALQPPHANHDFFQRMTHESITIDSQEINLIPDAARQTQTLVNVGFSERSKHSTATLYNSNILIDATGEILVHHRKLMPTFFEKLTWSPGDGAGLQVARTAFGNIGTLICGENTNPLARYALMSQAEEVHISTWPAVWPTRVGGTGNYDNVAANRIRGAAHCFEAKCFGILAAGVLDGECKDVIARGSGDPDMVRKQLDAAPQAASMFLDPTGAVVPGFVIQDGKRETREFLKDDEGVLYADLDLDLCIEGKQYHDVTGGYQRLDVFELKVNRTRREPATFRDEVD